MKLELNFQWTTPGHWASGRRWWFNVGKSKRFYVEYGVVWITILGLSVDFSWATDPKPLP